MNNNITFIIPNRGGTNIEFLIKQLKEKYPKSEYVVITQDDNEPFMRGQLWNIAYYFIKTDYMCFIDNDMFFPEFIDLINIYEQLKCMALQPFKKICQVKINNDGSITKISEAAKHPYGKGGVTFISKKKFEQVGGMSNLYVGYGCEDTELDYRCYGITDLDGTIYHIQHPNRCNGDKHFDINVKIAKTRHKRNNKKDGYNETKFVITENKQIDNVLYLKVNKIGVIENFEYKNLLKLHENI